MISLHIYVPFATKFKFFIFGFFSEPKMNVGDAQKRIPVVVKSKMTKVPRVEIFFGRLGSFFRSPHHNYTSSVLLLVWTRGAVCPPERGTCESRSQQIAGTSLSRFRRRGHQSKRILIEQKSKKHRKFLDPSAKPCRGFVVETAGPVLDP